MKVFPFLLSSPRKDISPEVELKKKVIQNCSILCRGLRPPDQKGNMAHWAVSCGLFKGGFSVVHTLCNVLFLPLSFIFISSHYHACSVAQTSLCIFFHHLLGYLLGQCVVIGRIPRCLTFYSYRKDSAPVSSK